MAAGDELKSSGITAATPDNILFGAGTIHKGLKFTAATKTWNFVESLVGATAGGSKLSIVPDVQQVEVDGALVRVQGLDVKQGETASLETNFAETTPDVIKAAVIGQLGSSQFAGYDVIESKSSITVDDYWENVAFVGKTLTGKPIIAILDNALCTSGMELEGKNKESAVGKYTFECTQKITGDHTKLPYHIYYPSATGAAVQSADTQSTTGTTK